jgi:hypothetical protein
LKFCYLGIAQRAKTRRVFLVLEVSFKTLSIHSPGADDYPRNTESSNRPYKLCACSFSVTGNAEVEAFAETDIMPGVMKLVFEVDKIDVHLHGHLRTKDGLSFLTAHLFSIEKALGFYLTIYLIPGNGRL